MTNSLAVFQPNNHSRYAINWKKIPNDLGRIIGGLVEQEYGLRVSGQIEEVDEWERMSNNFRVLVERKDRNEKSFVLLRKHIQFKDEKSILIVNKILDYLLAEGLFVPVVIPTLVGARHFFFEGHFYQLYEFISGNHFRGTKAELKDFALNLALLHNAFAKIPFKEEIAKKPIILPQWDEAGWKKIFMIAKKKGDKLDLAIKANQKLIMDSVDFVKAASAQWDSIGIQTVWGDSHPQNTLYRDEKLKAIIDFEYVGVSQLARDIGNACHRFVRQYVVHEAMDWRKTLPKGINLFFSAYGKKRQLASNELSAMPGLVQDALLRKLYKDINLYYLNGKSENLEGGELEKKIMLLQEAVLLKEYIA